MGLALRLGMTRAQLLASADSAELTDWMAFFTVQQAGKAGVPADKDVEAQLMQIFGPRHG